MRDFKLFVEASQTDQMLQNSLDQISNAFGEIRQKEDHVKGVVTNLYQYLKGRLDKSFGKQLGASFKTLGSQLTKKQELLADREKMILPPDKKDDAHYNLQKVSVFLDDPQNISGLPVSLYGKNINSGLFNDLRLQPDDDAIRQVTNNISSRVVQFRTNRGDGKMVEIGPEFDITNDNAVRSAIDTLATEMSVRRKRYGTGKANILRQQAAEKSAKYKAGRKEKGYAEPASHLPPEIPGDPKIAPPIPLAQESFTSWLAKRK